MPLTPTPASPTPRARHRLADGWRGTSLSIALCALALLWGHVVNVRAAEPLVVVAQVEGVIDPINAQYLSRVLRQAEANRADLLIIELDTPGGLATAMETMTQRLLASTTPTLVYVTPTGARAGSAGVFIAMAVDLVAMAPGTVIGAAHPVSIGGEQRDQATVDKVTNYFAAYARTLATTKGHNADWAEQAVRVSVTLTEQEAQQQGVVDIVARDLDDLLRQLEGRRVTTAAGPRVLPSLTGANLQRYPPNAAEAALHVIADPNIAVLLLTIGTIGIIAELYHPGAFFPGVAGVISLLLAFVSLGNLPTNWGAAALLSFSIFLFLLELKLPTHGVLGIGGVVAFVLGGLLLFAPLTPAAPVFETVEVNRWLLVGLSGLLATFFLVGLRAGLRARRMPIADPLAHLAGATGLATSTLDPAGTVLVHNEHWSAVTEGEPIQHGDTVEVIALEGLKLRVRRATPNGPTGPA
jgi:membrane-bound serine protease (ClpP class)